MRRRDFLALAGAVALPRIAFAEQPAKMPRVAVLSLSLQPLIVQSFEQGLAGQGYVVDKNIVVDLFFAPTLADLGALAAKAVATHPDVIWAYGIAATQAAKDASTSIPIVFWTAADPVQLGLVNSLAHPGGNLTGTVGLGAVASKLISFLTALVPNLSKLAVLQMTTAPVNDFYVADTRAAADALKIDLTFIDVKEGEDFRGYFAQAKASGAQAIYPFSTAYTIAPTDGKLFGDLEMQSGQPRLFDAAYLASQNNVISNTMLLAYLAVINQLPLIYNSQNGAQAGALLGYGADTVKQYPRAGYYIDAILKGAKPADLAIELPTNFELAVNLKAAAVLGLTVPSWMLAAASQVVE